MSSKKLIYFFHFHSVIAISLEIHFLAIIIIMTNLRELGFLMLHILYNIIMYNAKKEYIH